MSCCQLTSVSRALNVRGFGREGLGYGEFTGKGFGFRDKVPVSPLVQLAESHCTLQRLTMRFRAKGFLFGVEGLRRGSSRSCEAKSWKAVAT